MCNIYITGLTKGKKSTEVMSGESVNMIRNDNSRGVSTVNGKNQTTEPRKPKAERDKKHRHLGLS